VRRWVIRYLSPTGASLSSPCERLTAGGRRSDDGGMALHLIKLCVGADSVEDLQSFVDERLRLAQLAGQAAESSHVTRVSPKRAEEVLAGGSLYWVIRGQVQVRQRILRFDPVEGADGIQRCRIVLDPALHQTNWLPRRPFQGWRYLKPEDAPADLGGPGADGDEIPVHLRRELVELGLL
jgi:hypothetical protein